MIVIIVEAASPSLRGELSRWCLECKPGVFVSTVNATVREFLWEKVKKSDARAALMLYQADTELGIEIELIGDPTRTVIHFDGLPLICAKTQAKDNNNNSRLNNGIFER